MDGSGSPSVFISYARKDGRPIAERLLTSLADRGIGAWYDKRDLDPFQDYSAEIEDGIERSSHVAVCVTKASKDDESFVRREITYALSEHKRIVPLRFEDIPPHIQIITKTYIDFFGDWDVAFTEFLARLRAPQKDEEPTLHADPLVPHLEQLNQYVLGEIRGSVLNVDAILQLRAVGEVDRAARTLPIAYQSRGPGWFDKTTDHPKQPDELTFTSFQEAFEHHGRRTALLGQPGGGKTMTLLAFARDAVARRLANPKELLPVFAPVRSWAGQSDLVDWLSAVVETDASILRTEFDAGRALLLLDGLDELRGISFGNTEADPRRAFLRVVGDLDKTPLVITSRTAEWEELTTTTQTGLKLPATVRLLPLDDDQIAAYLAEDVYLHTALMEDVSLREMARNPLLLTLLALAYRDEGEGARKLRGLAKSPVELRARIFTKYVARRYEFEQARSGPKVPLRFSLDDLYEFLGVAAMDVLDRFQRVEVEIREDGYTVTQREGGPVDLVEVDVRSLRRLVGQPALELIAFAERLQLLVPVRDGWVRFAHLLLRDHFAVPRAIEQLGAEDPDLRRRAAGILGLAGDKRAVAPLVGALDDEDAAVRTLVLWALGEIRDPVSVAPIASIVRQDEESPHAGLMRSFGTAALGRIGGDESLAALESMLVLTSPTKRREVIGALGEIGPPAIPVLERALQESFGSGEAAAALGSIRDPRSTDALLGALERGMDDWYVIGALGNLGDPRAVPELAKRLGSFGSGEALTAIARIGGPAATDVLINELRERDPSRRSAVALALGTLGGADAIAALEKTLDDDDLRVRGAAVEALEKLGYDEATLVERRPQTRELLEALGDTDEQIRIEGARRLGARMEIGVADALAGALADPDPSVREAALMSLADLGDERAIEPLAMRLFEDDFDLAGVNTEVAAALGRIRIPEAASYLLPALDEQDWEGENVVDDLISIGAAAVGPLVSALYEADDEFAVAVGSVLASIGEPAIDPVIGLLGGPLNELAIDVLKAIGEPAAPAVAARLGSSSAVERAAAASTLGAIGSRETVQPIASLLIDEDRDVTNAAAEALLELGEPAIDALLAALAHPRFEVRSRAAWALGQIGDTRAVPALEAALDDPEAEVRWRAMRSLVGLAGSDLGDRLRTLANDPDVIVRLTVRDILGLDDGGPVEDALVAALRRDDPGLQVAAADALAERGSLEPLIDALGDSEGSVRDAAQSALLAIDDEQASPLTLLLSDSSTDVRLRIARLLALRGNVDAIRYLIGTLNAGSLADGDETAAILLGVPVLSCPLLLEKVHDRRAGPVAVELIRRAGQVAVRPLLELFIDGDERDQAVATSLLVSIGRPAVQPLIEVLEIGGTGEAIQVRAAAALGQINHPRAVAALATVALDPDEIYEGDAAVGLRVAAVHALAASQHAFAKPALRRVTSVRNRKVKKAAKEALG